MGLMLRGVTMGWFGQWYKNLNALFKIIIPIIIIILICFSFLIGIIAGSTSKYVATKSERVAWQKDQELADSERVKERELVSFYDDQLGSKLDILSHRIGYDVTTSSSFISLDRDGCSWFDGYRICRDTDYVLSVRLTNETEGGSPNLSEDVKMQYIDEVVDMVHYLYDDISDYEIKGKMTHLKIGWRNPNRELDSDVFYDGGVYVYKYDGGQMVLNDIITDE